MEQPRPDDDDASRGLLRAALAGDPAAWDAVLGLVRPYLRQVVRRRMGAAPAGGLSDSSLMQETMIRIHQHFGPQAAESARFQGGEWPEFLKWAGVIAGRIVSNAVRDAHADRRDRRRVVTGTAAADALAGLLSADTRADDELLAVRVAAALEKLPEGPRTVLELRYFEQQSFDDIARHLGRPPGTVRVIHLRALAELRERLGVSDDR